MQNQVGSVALKTQIGEAFVATLTHQQAQAGTANAVPEGFGSTIAPMYLLFACAENEAILAGGATIEVTAERYSDCIFANRGTPGNLEYEVSNVGGRGRFRRFAITPGSAIATFVDDMANMYGVPEEACRNTLMGYYGFASADSTPPEMLSHLGRANKNAIQNQFHASVKDAIHKRIILASEAAPSDEEYGGLDLHTQMALLAHFMTTAVAKEPVDSSSKVVKVSAKEEDTSVSTTAATAAAAADTISQPTKRSSFGKIARKSQKEALANQEQQPPSDKGGAMDLDP
mmetsp:Transcript_21734/g.50426  ORF Transcript_21734/g.50426 Transcript_21734/m.50426 type:complete len:287 (-) Transcript_21734:46-906(-)